MRLALLALSLMLAATPAVAAPKDVQVPPELTDPAIADKLGRMAGVLTKTLMDIPIGELEAAAQGREPTAADRSKTVRDHLGEPEAERKVAAQVAQSGRQMQAMSKALIASLPALMAALDEMESKLERAAANLPDPTYPKR